MVNLDKSYHENSSFWWQIKKKKSLGDSSGGGLLEYTRTHRWLLTQQSQPEWKRSEQCKHRSAFTYLLAFVVLITYSFHGTPLTDKRTFGSGLSDSTLCRSDKPVLQLLSS